MKYTISRNANEQNTMRIKSRAAQSRQSSKWVKDLIDQFNWKARINCMQNDNDSSGFEWECVSTIAQKIPPRQILVVDDDPDTRQLSVDALLSSDFEVDTAVDGADAWEALRVKHFDLVITDNKMPRMTGIELIEKLRYTRLALPIIMATSQLPVSEFERKPGLLPDEMLQRPFSSDDLLAAVGRVLRTDDANWNHMGMLLPKYL
jgi:CheY-like chemotaxis protein